MKRINPLFALAIIPLALIAVIMTSCSNNSSDPTRPVIANAMDPAGTQTPVLASRPAIIQAYYDSSLFDITLQPLPPRADSATLYHNPSINTIYMQEPGDTASVPVIDAIQRDGFNPLWREVDIVFNEGFPAHQFYSDNQILDAAGLPTPEIHLDSTNEMYICVVTRSHGGH